MLLPLLVMSQPKMKASPRVWCAGVWCAGVCCVGPCGKPQMWLAHVYQAGMVPKSARLPRLCHSQGAVCEWSMMRAPL